MTTLKDRTRTKVLELDAAGNRVDDIAAMLGITMDRVERILELEDPAHTFDHIEPSEPQAQPKRHRSNRRELAPCGTVSAYSRHRKAGQEPCEPCRLARKQYDAAYNEQIRAIRKDLAA